MVIRLPLTFPCTHFRVFNPILQTILQTTRQYCRIGVKDAAARPSGRCLPGCESRDTIDESHIFNSCECAGREEWGNGTNTGPEGSEVKKFKRGQNFQVKKGARRARFSEALLLKDSDARREHKIGPLLLASL